MDKQSPTLNTCIHEQDGVQDVCITSNVIFNLNFCFFRYLETSLIEQSPDFMQLLFCNSQSHLISQTAKGTRFILSLGLGAI